MKIILSGGTGFIGAALLRRFLEKGHRVVLLTRNPGSAPLPAAGAVEPVLWDAKTLGPWASHLEGADAVVNLAGESVAAGRWTRERKEKIFSSRIESTKLLVSAIAQAKKRPSVLVNASAVGYYGDVPEGEVSESFPQGSGFLAELCGRWEQEARAAEELGVRRVSLRIGVVLEKEGGALAKMLPPFYFFMGGPLGSGRQWFPWIHRKDVLEIILFALENPKVLGALNAAAPDPVNLKDFCSALGRALHRPSWAPVPAFALRLMLGEMSEILLTGQKAVPKRLVELGYQFRHPKLDQALASIFSRSP